MAAGLGVPEEWLAGELIRLPGNPPTIWEKYLYLKSAACAALKSLQAPRRSERVNPTLEMLCDYLVDFKDYVPHQWRGHPLPDEVKHKGESMTALKREVQAGRVKSATYKRSLGELEGLVATLGDQDEVARLFGKAPDPDAVIVHDFARWLLMSNCAGAWRRQNDGRPLDAEGFRVLGLIDSLLWSRWVGPLDVEQKEILAPSGNVRNRFRFLVDLLGQWLDGKATLNAARLQLLHEALVRKTKSVQSARDGAVRSEPPKEST